MQFLRYLFIAFIALILFIVVTLLDFGKNVLPNVFKLPDDKRVWVETHPLESVGIFVGLALLGGLLFYLLTWLWNQRTIQKFNTPTDVRARFLNLVRTYLENVLEARLKDVGHTLALEAQSGALIDQESATERVEQNTEALRQGALQPTINLIEAGHSERLSDGFLKSQGNADMQRLLILGNPGAGKSVVLTKLALEMVRAAQDKPGAPVNVQKSIPVLLNLAGWGASKQNLEDWIATETAQVYGLGSGAVKYHLQRNDLALLLDGLDELNEADQAKCVTEINKLINGGQSGNLAISVIVCSRAREYGGLLAEQKKLELSSTWQLQVLSDAQIDQYLKRVGPTANGLRNTLKTGNPSSTALQELVRVPLYLQVATVALQGVDFSQVSPEALKETLWKKYVDRMFDRATRGAEQVTPKMGVVRLEPYTKVEAMRYLAFLGAMMKRQGLIEMYLERLQPVFLPRAFVTYFRWTFGLLFGIVGGSIVGMTVRFASNSGYGFTVGLAGCVAGVLASGFTIGWVWGLIFAASVGAVVGIVFSIKFGLFMGLSIGLAIGLYNLTRSRKSEEILIRPIEKFSWSWSKFQLRITRSLVFGLIGGIAIALAVGLIGNLIMKVEGIFIVSLSVWLSGGFVYGLTYGLAGGWSTETVPETQFARPNEGILRTLGHTALNGFFGALLGSFMALLEGIIRSQGYKLVVRHTFVVC
jgi:hypothetical protein